MISPALFSSKNVVWETPRALFNRLDAVFRFTLDVCATPDNAKCRQFFSETDDGLAQEWTGTCWMNPPYGRTIGQWVKKALDSSIRGGATVVCLLPARTDTAWWHDYCMAGTIAFIRGRLKFGGSKNSTPFPSAVVAFSPIPTLSPQELYEIVNNRVAVIENVQLY